jgi:DNA (cytosine-5)-methyltransferase 1
MKHASLFSGIGGFDLAAEWMGWDNLFHCKWNVFGQKVLKHHFPKSIGYNDITKTDFSIHRGTVDILTGGFPCQPYSLAGKRKGKEDERHLWPEMLRAIREIQPRWVVGENVFGLINWSVGLVFHEVQTDLEAEGYEVFSYVLPACAVNAPHRRDRVWFVAYNDNIRQDSSKCEYEINTSEGGQYALNDINEVAMHTNNTSEQGEHIGQTGKGKFNGPDSGNGFDNFQNFPTQSPICGGDDGLPTELDGITFSKWRNESIKAFGNAIVPQVAYQIFKSIQQYETMRQMPNG